MLILFSFWIHCDLCGCVSLSSSGFNQVHSGIFLHQETFHWYFPKVCSQKTFFDSAASDLFALSSLKNLFVLLLKMIWAGTAPTIPVCSKSHPAWIWILPGIGHPLWRWKFVIIQMFFEKNFVGRRDVTAAFWCPNCYTRNAKLCRGSFSFFPDKSFLFFSGKLLYLSLIFIWLKPFCIFPGKFYFPAFYFACVSLDVWSSWEDTKNSLSKP